MANKRACVIGSGFGGLAAAIRLQAAGIQTTIMEKRDQPGGRAYVYRDQGFTFDAGPTVITAPDVIYDLFKLSGKDHRDYIELMPVMPFYRLFWEDGTHFDYSNLDARLLEEIRKISPDDVQGYLKFRDYTEEVFKEGFEKLAHVPFLNPWKMVQVAPQLIKLKAYNSVYKMVSKFIKHPKLREAFSFHSLLVGGSPFRSTSIYTLIHFLERKWGVFFPRGGTGALVSGLVRLFKDLGGEIRLNSPVEEITIVRNHVSGIITHNGRLERYDLIVSNADVVHTYQDLIKNHYAIKKKAKRLSKKKQSMSLFLIYFGTKKKYPHLAHHNVIFGPRYKELLEDIFTHGVLADDFSLYLHVPSLTDPKLAPPDGEAFYVLSPVPHLGLLPIDWRVEGPRYAKKILTYLEDRYLPGLRDHIVTKRIFTPLDFKGEFNSHMGSAFSFEPILRQSAYFRPQNRDNVIGGLYFAGAGTHPGAGIPGVMSSARATADLILKDYHISPRYPTPTHSRKEPVYVP